jgi:hypothetical protein
MATNLRAPLTADIWHLSIDDLLAPLPEKPRLGGPGPFVINLSSSTADVGLPSVGFAGCEDAVAYEIQRNEDGRTRFRLRLGPFESEDEAEAILEMVREVYPSALTATAGPDDLRTIASKRAKALASAETRRGSSPAAARGPAPERPRIAAPAATPAPTVTVPTPVVLSAVTPPLAAQTPPLARTPPVVTVAPIEVPVVQLSLVPDRVPVNPPTASVPDAVPVPIAATPPLLPVSSAVASRPAAATPVTASAASEANAVTATNPIIPTVVDATITVTLDLKASPFTELSLVPELSLVTDFSLAEEISLDFEPAPTVAVKPKPVVTPKPAATATPVAATPVAATPVAATPVAAIPAAAIPAAAMPAAAPPKAIAPSPSVSKAPQAASGPPMSVSAPLVNRRAAATPVAPVRMSAAKIAALIDNAVPAPKETHVVKAAPVAKAATPLAIPATPLAKPAPVAARAAVVSPPARAAAVKAEASKVPAPHAEKSVSIDSTQTVRALTAVELQGGDSLPWFVIQLKQAQEAFDPDTVPNLDIFSVYRLYCVAHIDNGQIQHALRVGFFSEEIAAKAVASYLAGYYDEPAIRRVSAAERERFADQRVEARKDIGATGRHAVIEITDDLVARRNRSTEYSATI